MRMTGTQQDINLKWSLALLIWLLPTASVAQEPIDTQPEKAEAASEPTVAEVADTSPQNTEPSDARIDALTKRIEQLEARDAENRQQIAELQAQSYQELDEDYGTEEGFTLSGFFDFELRKWMYDEGALAGMFLPDNPFFTIARFNLYMKSVLTESLSVLGELRFSFLPQGTIDTYEYEGMPAEGIPSQGIFGNRFTRVDTRVQDPTTTLLFPQGGLTIERIHLTYSPADWFNILVGRYLTPFGIWNIDHGSPVVISSGLPYLMIRELVPPAQTGLQLYGRLFPWDMVYFDYALTASNGRGPLESYIDLDDNKGVGLRLKLSYQGDDFTIAGGGYGYTGKTSDSKDIIHIIGLSSQASEDRPILSETIPNDVCDEHILSSDILIEAFGLRLQAEYAYRYQDFSVNRPMESEYAILQTASPLDELFHPSEIGHDFYVLLAYTLPLHRWLHPVLITPYAMFEYGHTTDIFLWANANRYLAGVNIKPSPFVTLKLEGLISVMGSDIVGKEINSINAQVAVSF